MKIFKAILAFIGMVFSGLWGGQKNKAVRRFGIPGIALFTGFSFGWSWRYLAFLLFVPVLCLGYGVDSVLGGFLGHTEWLIRAVYASMLSVPFVFWGWRRWAFACVALIVAFQIHAGSIASFNGFDILIEDLIRYSTLGGLILYSIIKK